MRLRAAARAALLALGLAGCASPGPRLGAQWADPQFPQHGLQGAAVLVVCDSVDTALRLHCEADASSRLLALGARPVTDAAIVHPTPGREAPAGQFVGAARAAGARAIFSATLAPDFSQPSAVPTFSIGIGGFGGSGGSRGGSGFGGGVGVTLPAGGTASAASGLAAIASVIDADSGRVVWTARATTPPGADVVTQVGDALRTLVVSLAQAGVF